MQILQHNILSIFCSHKRITFILGYIAIAMVSCILNFPSCIIPRNSTKSFVWIPILAVLIMGLIRVTRWCKHAYRDALLAYLLISANIITLSCGMEGYLIGAVGVAIWYTQSTRYRTKTIIDPILAILFLLCCCIPSLPWIKEITPNAYISGVRITHLPLLLIWLKQSIELLSWEYRDFSLELHAEEPNKWQLIIKKYLDNGIYCIAFVFIYVLSKIPFCVMYVISTIISTFLFHIIGYRRKVVHNNIKDSFPEKSKIERFKIERMYYVHLCDLFIESIKYFSISETSMRKRLVYTNGEVMKDSLRRGKMVGLYLGHFCNWEWISSMPLLVGELGQCSQLYHPLQNMIFDRLVAYTRERWGGVNIPASESIRHIIKLKQQGKPLVIGFIADQVPMTNSIHYWTNFLNHKDTPVFTGAERLMKKLDMDVYYVDVHKVKRGYYEITFKLITSTPKEYPDFQITEEYTQLLEKNIREEPPYWLWSHNRWKRTRN